MDEEYELQRLRREIGESDRQTDESDWNSDRHAVSDLRLPEEPADPFSGESGRVAAEKEAVRRLGKAIGYGRLMQAASDLWADSLGGDGGGAFAVGPCRGSLVRCCTTGCDWCEGSKLITERVAEAKRGEHDWTRFLDDRAKWSAETFGPVDHQSDTRHIALVEHIRWPEPTWQQTAENLRGTVDELTAERDAAVRESQRLADANARLTRDLELRDLKIGKALGYLHESLIVERLPASPELAVDLVVEGCRKAASIVAELSRIKKLFDDAGQGEYNVLALVDHYAAEAEAGQDAQHAVRALRDLVDELRGLFRSSDSAAPSSILGEVARLLGVRDESEVETVDLTLESTDGVAVGDLVEVADVPSLPTDRRARDEALRREPDLRDTDPVEGNHGDEHVELTDADPVERAIVAYMMAPVSPSNGRTVEENLETARKWLHFLRTITRDLRVNAQPIVIIAPWIASIEAGASEASQTDREHGLRDDCAVAARCDFTIAVGSTPDDRLTAGMLAESQACRGPCLNFLDLGSLYHWPVSMIDSDRARIIEDIRAVAIGIN